MYSHSPDYLKISLQVLGGILLIVLIFIAWEVKSWLSKENNEIQTSLISHEATVPHTEKNHSVITPIEIPPITIIADKNDFSPTSIFEDSTKTPTNAPSTNNHINTQETSISSVTPLVKAEKNSEILPTETSEPEPAPEPTPQPEGITEPDMVAPSQDIEGLVASSMAQIKSQEEQEYVANLVTANTSDAVKNTSQKLANETLKPASSQTVDVYNKIKVSSSGNHSNIQNQLRLLVNSSMNPKVDTAEKPVNSPKTSIDKTSESYISGLKQEVKTRLNEMRTITVRKGDTLGKIAKRAYGKSSLYKKIYTANPEILANPHRLKIGQILRVPK